MNRCVMLAPFGSSTAGCGGHEWRERQWRRTRTDWGPMPLLPANAALLQTMAALGIKRVTEATPQEVRDMQVELAALTPRGPDVANVEDVSLETPDGDSITLRILVPHGEVAGVIVYFHGGGWVIGSMAGYDAVTRKLAVGTGHAVVNVDYRLAPEFPYPTAVDDCQLAFDWVATNLDRIIGATADHATGAAVPAHNDDDSRQAQTRPTTTVPLVVAGDSAGGNLAAVVARRRRDRGDSPITMQVLIYPVTDCDTETASYLDPDNQLLLDRAAMLSFWDHYLPDPARRAEPDASPLRTADLAGLPPTLVITAEYDPLLDEGEAYAHRLEAAGVPTTLIRHDGQMHGFFGMVAEAGNDAAIAQIADALAQAARRGPPP